MNEELVQHGFTVQDEVPVEENYAPQQYEQEQHVAQIKERRRSKNKNPASERISRLINENRTKDQINMSLQAELAEKERILSIQEQELRYKEISNQNLFENSLKAEEHSIVQGLKAAKEEGDIDREIEFQRDLARIKSDQSTFDVLKAQQQYAAPQDVRDLEDTTFYPDMNPHAYDNLYEDQLQISEEFADFAERNPWINPNAREFSPELAQEADNIAAEFNKRLKFNNQAYLIGTDEYFSTIENFMHNTYSNGQQQEYQQPQRSYQPAPVTGVSRQGATMADQYLAKSRGGHNDAANSLTPEEYRIARNLQIPSSTEVGKFLSSDQAVKMYAQSKNKYSRMQNTPTYKLSID